MILIFVHSLWVYAPDTFVVQVQSPGIQTKRFVQIKIKLIGQKVLIVFAIRLEELEARTHLNNITKSNSVMIEEGMSTGATLKGLGVIKYILQALE